MAAASVNSSTQAMLNRTVSQAMASSLGISDWTSNMTYDKPQSLLDQLEDYREPESVLFSADQSWYRPYPATLSLILILHAVFLLQWNQRRTKKHAWVSYQQLIVKKQWYRAWCATLSHPPQVDSIQRDSGSTIGSLSISFGNSPSTGTEGREGRAPLLQIARKALYPLTKGPFSGLPLMMYNCHLLWTCRALEPLFSSSWHYLRSLLALAALSLAIELAGRYSLVQRTAHVAGRANNNTNYGSIQPEFGSDPIVRIRRLALYQPMGTSTSLLFAVLFLYNNTFPHVSLQAIPILPTSSLVPSWMSYFWCVGLLVALSSSRRLPCFFAGNFAGCLWILGFHFLGKLYWACWLVLWLSVVTLLSLKPKYPNMTPGVDYVSWNAVGIVHDGDGVPVVTSLDGSSSSTADEEWEHDEDNGTSRDGVDESSMVDPENPIRGRLPMMNLDEEEESLLSHPGHAGRLIRRNGTAP